MLTHQRVELEGLGGLTVLVGLLFGGASDRFPLAWLMLRPSARPLAGLAGAALLGITIGIGWTPRIGPALAAVLSLAVTTGSAPRALLSFMYGLAIGSPFWLAAALDRGMRLFSLAHRRAALVTRVGSGLLVVVGILQAIGARGTS